MSYSTIKSFIPFSILILVAIQGYPQELSRIKVEGNSLINEQGETLVLRGVNTSDPDKLEENGHWDKAYFKENLL